MVTIIDYGMGNVGSVKNALGALGVEAVVSAAPEDVKRASHLVVPGVGAFSEGMRRLSATGLVPLLNDMVLERKKPLLGICLGMQMFAQWGEEGGKTAGLGWVKGVTRHFAIDEAVYRLPHIGWNDVAAQPGSVLFAGVKRPIFYFVHSYVLAPATPGVISGVADYGGPFAAAIEADTIFGVQFHPEKSQEEGLRVLQNFLAVPTHL